MKALKFKVLVIALISTFGLLRWGCSGNSDVANDGRTAPLLEGMGDLHHPITTSNKMAQRYFNQGLALSYGFNHKEAERSFREVARLDSNSAMAWWGVALVLGPNINAAMDNAEVPNAYNAIQKALELAPKASERERVYIEALAKRYAAEPVEDRKPLDEAYATAMREVTQRYPDDADAAALAAEALMDLHPWDFWEKDGQPKPWTPSSPWGRYDDSVHLGQVGQPSPESVSRTAPPVTAMPMLATRLAHARGTSRSPRVRRRAARRSAFSWLWAPSPCSSLPGGC